MNIEDLKSVAEQGDPNDQFKLGWKYYSGSGVTANREEAIKWFRKAAEQKFSNAQKMLFLLTGDETQSEATEVTKKSQSGIEQPKATEHVPAISHSPLDDDFSKIDLISASIVGAMLIYIIFLATVDLDVKGKIGCGILGFLVGVLVLSFAIGIVDFFFKIFTILGLGVMFCANMIAVFYILTWSTNNHSQSRYKEIALLLLALFFCDAIIYSVLHVVFKVSKIDLFE